MSEGCRRESQLLGVVGLLLLSAWLACAPAVRPLGPAVPPSLRPDEGILILHVDSDVPVGSLLLEEGVLAEHIDAGHHVWMLRVGAGRYCWKGVRLPQSRGVQPLDQEECHFDVEPGVINYPGAIVIRDPQPSVPASMSLWIRALDRGGMAIRTLRRDQSEILDAFPIRYTGHGDDPFLEYYDRARRGASATPSAARDPSGATP